MIKAIKQKHVELLLIANLKQAILPKRIILEALGMWLL
jgi:hypothetical protein